MDRQRVREWEAQCVQEQPPACSAACPLHVNARKLLDCARKGDFKGGLKVFASFVPLPRITAAVCDQPCHAACRRKEAGEALNIRAVEQACVEFGGPVPPIRKVGIKQQRVAVVGGGLSGVTAALELSAKGYEVTLYEAGDTLLSRMRAMGEDLLPQAVIDADLEPLEKLGVQVKLQTLISFNGGDCGIAELIEKFDAVYMGCGQPFDAEWQNLLAKDNLNRIQIDPLTYATSHARVFGGGTLRYSPAPYSPITSIQEGRYAAVSVDRYLQGASLLAGRENEGLCTSKLYTDISGYEPTPEVKASSADGHYSREEAQQEAVRCFPCSCMECVKTCEYLKEYGSYPKRYVREIYNNLCIVMGTRNLNKMINSCSLCGLCEVRCPEHVSMAEICLDARQTMVETQKMPVSAHEFALRDMAFSASDSFAMARHQPGHSSSAALFFPGCQLSASSPEHVQSCYEFLCASEPGGIGLVLGCCGAPALWAGRKDLFDASMQQLEATWTRMGKPRIITACSSCFRTLKEAKPEIQVQSLWPHLNHEELLRGKGNDNSTPYAIHDPCSTRGVEEVEGGARDLLRGMGVLPLELNPRGETTCCGYGGLACFVNPELTARTIQRRAAESTADFITYCAMCRDSFARQGKRALHVLDLIFPEGNDDAAARKDPGYSGRQENRARLKKTMLERLWKEGQTAVKKATSVHIPEEIVALMERRMILREDVCTTIEHAELTGEKMMIPGNGHLLACYRPACVTYWVEYAPANDTFDVFNVYSHRMQVR
ncbi:MAG: heterodisulfide reductase-related iron-sulfur binding cluster [Acidobacteriota bacterium]|nr:heterodisulfide reductase-related iron-sulfur binding cluster [Acidobacteriota bacterium]